MSMFEIPQQTNILVIDDSPDSLTMLTDALDMEGMKVTVATSGRQAFGAIEQNFPDIILMDAMMPGLDGFETCQVLKTEKGCEDIPVIFMTGLSESEHVVRAFASGGVDFITKPIILDQLFARIRVHLANARRVRSAQKALDSTGRRILSCDNNGAILWATPQAADLLRNAGIRHEEASRLPWEIVDAVLTQGSDECTLSEKATFLYEQNGVSIGFRLLEGNLSQTDNSVPLHGPDKPSGPRKKNGPKENLIRLLDGSRGSDQECLARAFGLTLREAEVLLWITHGKSNKEIAEILNMSPRTVNKHLEQIFIKMAVENRTAAATMSVRVLWRD